MILLAVAAKAQNNPPSKNNNQGQQVIKKKPITAEEAKVIYEHKNKNTGGDKRKSYSRKDIEKALPAGTTEPVQPVLSNDNKITNVFNPDSINNKIPKAIYKGPVKTVPDNDSFQRKVVPLFIDHIEISITPGNQ